MVYIIHDFTFLGMVLFINIFMVFAFYFNFGSPLSEPKHCYPGFKKTEIRKLLRYTADAKPLALTVVVSTWVDVAIAQAQTVSVVAIAR